MDHLTLPWRRVTDRLVVAGAIFLSASLLSACGGGGGGGGGGSYGSPATVGNTTTNGLDTGSESAPNRPPTISADPPNMIMAGTAYSYVPTASDSDNDSLYFLVSGLPSWASFDPWTGEISGRPTTEDIGAHMQIVITVEDERGGRASTRSFGISVVASALGAATLNWSPPLERADGTPLTDLAGYTVYWSLNPDNFVNSVVLDNPGLTSYMVTGLTRGTWYFTVTAFDSEGVSSPFAGVASKVID